MVVNPRQAVIQGSGCLGHLINGTTGYGRWRQPGLDLGQRLGKLLKPLAGAVQGHRGGKMVEGLVRQMMGLVEDVQGVLRLRQDGTATQRQVGQHQVVVGHYHIGGFQALAGVEERAVIEVGAMPVGTLAVIGGDLTPDIIGYGGRPVIPVAIPFAGGVLAEHVLEEFTGAGLLLAALIQQEQGHGVTVAMAFILKPRFQAGHAQIAAPTLGQGPVERQAGVLFQIRQVLGNDLVLQCHGGSGDDQGLAQGPRHRNGGNQVAQGLAGAGARLHHTGGRG